jgi:WD40 repeat protein
MAGERFARLRALVEAGHDLEEADLARFLDAECRGDAELRKEALELIQGARESAALFEPPDPGCWAAILAGSAERGPDDRRPDRRIGAFRILERIASGGMGTVFAAEQDEPRRKVALKVLRLDFDGPDDVKRFRREAEILSRLQHPHVAQVFAAGVEQDPTGGPGLPWYAMEFIEGARPLSDHARELPLDERLALFATLCRAVQHGHERGVIHRDLKPGNVLVDRAGALKVIDFGVAAVAGAAANAGTRLTRPGTLVGTLDYMAPERFTGRAEEHDTRGDVYSLGVLLYELVCGRLPHDLAGASLFEAAQIVQERDPPPPSAVARAISPDLEAVVQKALAHERGTRYASAAALADDVERVRRGEPVDARPPTVLTQVRSLARRHRLLLAGVLGSVLALCVGLAVSLALLLRALHAERDARAGAEAYRRRDYVATIAAAHGALRTGDVNRAAHFLALAPPDLRGFEWQHLHARTDRSIDTWPTGAEAVEELLWLEGGERAVVALRDGQIELRSAAGEHLAELRPPGVPIFDLDVDPQGLLLAAALREGGVLLLPLAEGTAARTLAAPLLQSCAAFSPDGQTVASGGMDGAVRLWRTPEWAPAMVLEAGRGWPADVAFLPSGDQLVVGFASGAIEIFDACTGASLLELDGQASGQLSEISVSSDGTLLAAAYHGGVVQVWSLPGGELTASLQGHAGIVERLAFAPAEPLLASAGRDRSIRLWDASTGTALARLLGHTCEVTALEWSPDGDVITSGDERGRVKLWSRATEDVVVAEVQGRWSWELCYSPDGEVLGSLHGGFAELRDPRSGRVLEEIPALSSASSRGYWSALDFDPTGELLALGDIGGMVRISALRDSSGPAVFQSGVGDVGALAWTRAGERLAVGGASGRVAWFTGGGAPAGEELVLPGAIQALEHSSAGALAALDATGCLVLVAPHGTRSVHQLESGAAALVWCGEERIAIGTARGPILLFDTRAGAVSGSLPGHRRRVYDLALAPGGARLASSSEDRSIRFFDLERGLETWVNDEHDYLVLSIAFAPDGATLASGSADGTLRLWDTRVPRRGRLDDPAELATVAWMLALEPEADPVELLPLAEALRTRCASDAGDPELLGALAAVELGLGRPAEALEALARRLAMARETPELLLLRSVALGSLGCRAEAQDARERARSEAGAAVTIGVLARLMEASERAIGP